MQTLTSDHHNGVGNVHIDARTHETNIHPSYNVQHRHTDCGQYWENLSRGCYRCNGGPHYHSATGECDTEPCYEHGGPA